MFSLQTAWGGWCIDGRRTYAGNRSPPSYEESAHCAPSLMSLEYANSSDMTVPLLCSVADPLWDSRGRAQALQEAQEGIPVVELVLPQASTVRCLTSLQIRNSWLAASGARFLPDEANLASSALLCSGVYRFAQ